MQIKRKNIFKKYKWLKEKKRPFIISSDYDGLICASFLSHYLNWELVGYYDYNSIWLSKDAHKYKKKIIWVDLNILPKAGKSIGGQIVSIDQNIPPGFETSFNANIIANITSEDFKHKFPFSTLLLLMWLYNIQYKKNDIGKLLILHSDNSWMKIQKYQSNVNFWIDKLENYNWDVLFDGIDSIDYENKIDQFLYSKLIQMGAVSKFGKLSSKYLNIKSREGMLNPDWDGDIFLNLFHLYAEILGWTPPQLPSIYKRIEGKKFKLPLSHIKAIGLNKFLKDNKIFSYAITNPTNFSYTIFQSYYKND